MANDELIALLNGLQGSSANHTMSSGLLAQLPSLVTAVTGAAEPQSASTASRAGNSAASTSRSVGGGLTLLPMVSSLLQLFGIGAGEEEPSPLEKFALPAPIRAEAGLSQSGETFLIDRGVGDRIRTLPAPPPVTGSSNSTSASLGETGPSITVNVQAMDSQSFMDRREDIARAVREAMLQSHSLNDVVSEL